MPLRSLLLCAALSSGCKIVTDAEVVTHNDPDGDGYPVDQDCDEGERSVNPGQAEIAYNGRDDDCDPGTADDDLDSDGFSGADGGEDCDDDDDATHPSAAERCDEIDNDCDGLIDEDGGEEVTRWYRDQDGDGHGDPAVSTSSCGRPDGYVTSGDDCDDTDSGTSPAATELCDDKDNDCDDAIDDDAADSQAWCLDADGDGEGDPDFTVEACAAPDGYTSTSDCQDCDDGDPSVNSDAEERCDELERDEDCDGIANVGAVDASIWYGDTDADGYGDRLSSELSCEAPEGAVSDPTDCDDGDPLVSPSAAELCNGIDDDCDDEVDEDDADDAVTWYADRDDDTFGYAYATRDACAAPAAYVSDATDCDDTDGEVHPGAAETAADGLDQDCDGLERCYVDEDGDGEAIADGMVDSPDLGCDPPPEAATAGTDCDDDDSAVSTGADEVCGDGQANDCSLDEAAAHLICRASVASTSEGALATYSEADRGAEIGSSLAHLTLDDGDGALIIGGYGATAATLDVGAAWIVSDDVGASGSAVALSTAARHALWGSASNDQVGWAVSVGDADGDGVEDLLVTAPRASEEGRARTGSVRLYTGAAIREEGELSAAATWAGDTYTYAGQSVAVLPEAGLVAVGAANPDEGLVYVLSSGELGLTLEATLTGEIADGMAGENLLAGDLDGDGVEDLVIAATDASRLYAVIGPLSGDAGLGTADWIWSGASGDLVGTGLSLCDLDGSGKVDLVVGSLDASALAGTAHLIFDPSEGGALADHPSWTGTSAGDRVGTSIACGDLDGDAHDEADDLIVGAKGVDAGFEENAGAVFLFFGPLSGAPDGPDASTTGQHTGAGFGSSLLIAGDHDADGRPELAVGAPDAATELDGEVTFDAGAVYLLQIPLE